MKATQKRGIILLACGHKYYGKMAAALAASLRVNGDDTPILVYEADNALGYLKPAERELFSEIKQLPAKTYTTKTESNQWLRAKTYLYDLTPFEETLYLDVDLIFNPKRTSKELFESFADIPFTSINEGFINNATGESTINSKYTIWADYDSLKKAMQDNEVFMSGKYYMLRTEMIYFKKGEAARQLFKEAKSFYDNPPVKVATIGGRAADEFAFSCACAINNIYPHKDKYAPIYWHYFHDRLHLSRGEMFTQFHAYSIGGNVSTSAQKQIYNDISKVSYNKLRLQFPYQMRDKKTFLPERIKL